MKGSAYMMDLSDGRCYLMDFRWTAAKGVKGLAEVFRHDGRFGPDRVIARIRVVSEGVGHPMRYIVLPPQGGAPIGAVENDPRGAMEIAIGQRATP